MRLKHVIERLSLTAWIRLVYERITLTRFTTLFVTLALAHCLVQIALQTASLVFNRSSYATLSRVLDESGEPRLFAFVVNDVLSVCNSSNASGRVSCFQLTGHAVPMNVDALLEDSSSHKSRSIRVRREPNAKGHSGKDYDYDDDDNSSPPSNSNSSTINAATGLPEPCIAGLNWPEINMYDARREDITFLATQVWLFAISLVTILNESVPHLITSLTAHGLTVAWSAFQVSRTHHNKFIYKTLIVQDLCGGKDVIPEFWSIRMNYFVPILVLNVIAFVVMLATSYKLFGIYTQQTMKRVGASSAMMKRYLVILLFSVCLSLSAFFALVSSAIWLDMLFNGVLSQFTDFLTAYRAIFIIVCIAVLPWVTIGWNTFRRENRLWSLVFLLMGLAITVATSSMFASTAYKPLFDNFPFFATVSIASYIILVLTNVLAVMCRLNFGKGLPQCLTTEKNFDDASFVPVVVPPKRRSLFRQSRRPSTVFPDKPIVLTLNREADEGPAIIDIKGVEALTKVKNVNEDLDPLETPRASLFERATRSLRTLSTVSSSRESKQRKSFLSSTVSTPLPNGAAEGSIEYVIPTLPKLLAPKVNQQLASSLSKTTPAAAPTFAKQASPPVRPAVRPPEVSVQRDATGRPTRVRIRPPALNLGAVSNLSISAPQPMFLDSRWSPTTMATSTATSPSVGSSVSRAWQPPRQFEARLGPGPGGPRIALMYGSMRPDASVASGAPRSLPSNPRAFVGRR